MKKIILIDMPFSLPECPAFGLTQLKSYADASYGERVQTNILYLNHDFYHYMGEDFYKTVSADFYDFYKFSKNKNMWVDNLEKSGLEVDYFNGGIGDWFFRNEAFPDAFDNTEIFFSNVKFKDKEFQRNTLEKRAEVGSFLETLIDQYHIDSSDIVGFTSRFQQQMAALALARRLKERKPEILIFIGGPNCEPPAGAELAKNIEMVDYVLSGRRFLKGFGQFIDYYLEGSKEKIGTITGVYTCGVQPAAYLDYPLKRTGFEMGEEDDISDFIELNYDSYFQSLEEKKLIDVIEPVLFFETSRGCQWGEKERCRFCAIDGYNPQYRIMETEKAIEYLDHIFSYGDRCKYFIATDSCFPKQYLMEVFPYVNIPEHIHILYEVRVNFTEREIGLLAGNKIDLLIAGIESLSNEALRLLNKGTTVFDNIKFLKMCRKHNLNINWNILVGIPGETEEIIQKNASVIPYLYHFYPPTGVWLVSYQGNCVYNQEPEKYHLSLKPSIEALSYAYPFTEESLNKMSYFKDLDNKKEVFTYRKARSIQRVSYYANIWKKKWRQEDKNLLPKLTLKDSGERNLILDTREDTERIYEIDERSLAVLRLLNYDARNRAYIYQHFEQYEEHALEDILNNLIEKKLMYEENDTFISLLII